MATTRGNLFDPKVVSDIVSKVKGKSSLAVLSNRVPVSFNGNKEFTFSFDKEVDIVGEGGKKTAGGITLEPVVIVPIKFEYGARVTDEFMYATDEEKIEILKEFNDGFAKKIARGLDIAAFHGLNPRTGEASTVVGEKHFDSKITATVNYTEATPDANLEAAIALVENKDREVTGMVISPAMRTALAAMKNSANEKLYPEFAFGGKPTTLGATTLDINSTVATGGVDHAIVGDFENMFKWGYAKEVPMEIIEYGDPDNSGMDLKGYNQVYIRAEMYIGWGILDADSFARVKVA